MENEIYEKTETPIFGNKKVKSGYNQWSLIDDKLIPSKPTIKQMPAGMYRPCWDSNVGMYVAKNMDFNMDELFTLPVDEIDKVLLDIRKFWNNEELYYKFESVYKRGILLYGIPGCGKSSIILLLAQDLIKNHNGIIFNVSNFDELNGLFDIIPYFKEIEQNRKIIVVLEDVDIFFNGNSQDESRILNFLDGGMSIDGLVTIATTNYPEKLQERVVNRPSRFDRRYEIGKPNAEVRRYYLENKLKIGGLELSKEEIENIVDNTEGLTIDHLKEYFLSVFVLGYSHDEAIKDIDEISATKILKNSKGKSKIGFVTENPATMQSRLGNQR